MSYCNPAIINCMKGCIYVYVRTVLWVIFFSTLEEKKYFTMRVVKHWNRLHKLMESPFLQVFKT